MLGGGRLVAQAELVSVWDRLGEDDRDILLTLAQALAGGVFKSRGVLALIPFTTVQLRDAFLRLHQQPDTVNITLTFPRGGAQAVKGIDATGRAREEDQKRVG